MSVTAFTLDDCLTVTASVNVGLTFIAYLRPNRIPSWGGTHFGASGDAVLLHVPGRCAALIGGPPTAGVRARRARTGVGASACHVRERERLCRAPGPGHVGAALLRHRRASTGHRAAAPGMSTWPIDERRISSVELPRRLHFLLANPG